MYQQYNINAEAPPMGYLRKWEEDDQTSCVLRLPSIPAGKLVHPIKRQFRNVHNLGKLHFHQNSSIEFRSDDDVRPFHDTA